MPNRDGTGPEGKGSKTGRGLGNCSPDKTNPKQRPLGRRFLGKGQRRGLSNS